MDQSTLQTGGISAGLVVACAVLYKIYTAVNHHKIRARCCGKVLDASLDIDTTDTDSPDPRTPKTTLAPRALAKIVVPADTQSPKVGEIDRSKTTEQ
jgi:hypothetical protein